MTYPKRGRYSFSLIELSIVFCIIVLISSFFVFDLRKGLEKYRFETNKKKLDNLIQFSQKIAITHQIDVFLSFQNHERKLICKMESDEKEGFFCRNLRREIMLEDLILEIQDENTSHLSIIFRN